MTATRTNPAKRCISCRMVALGVVAGLAGLPAVGLGSEARPGTMRSAEESGPDADRRIEIFAPPPTATKSDRYRVEAAGRPVFVQSYKDVHYAHFAFGGHARVCVAIDEPVREVRFSPQSLEIDHHVRGNSLEFVLSRPCKLVIRLNGRQRLFLFADSLEKSPFDPGQPGVVNVRDFDADNTGTSLVTEPIRRAVAATPRGGVLYFPRGVYRTATVRLRSEMTLYLAPGALLLGSADAADYPDRDVDVHRTLGPPNVRLLLVEGVENVRVAGYGTIDGQGRRLRGAGSSGQVIVVKNSRNVLVENLILRDPASYNTRILFSEHVTFRNTKVINDQEVPNTDGIDPEGSRHVLIEENFAYCGDDNVAVKIYHYDVVQDVHDVVVRGNVFLTRKSALKIGTETKQRSIRDVTFADNDVIECDRAMAIYVADGADVSRVRFLDNRIESHYPDRRQRVIEFEITRRLGAGRISDVVIQDTRVNEPFPRASTMRGLDDAHPIRGVRIVNYRVGGKVARNLEEAHLELLEHVEDVELRVE